jgi:hypothetical protein
MGLFVTLSINDTQHYDTSALTVSCAKCRYTECRVFIAMLSVIMLNFVVLSVVAPNDKLPFPRLKVSRFQTVKVKILRAIEKWLWGFLSGKGSLNVNNNDIKGSECLVNIILTFMSFKLF